ncbi:MAG: hypothetical protein K2X08_05375 [Chlamydiales bacterium]|nr:hypothetical protein [Chlamydiales bacterium]MBY0463207.1 hypothetical protein [Alphaproteobacteria bacterium]
MSTLQASTSSPAKIYDAAAVPLQEELNTLQVECGNELQGYATRVTNLFKQKIAPLQTQLEQLQSQEKTDATKQQFRELQDKINALFSSYQKAVIKRDNENFFQKKQINSDTYTEVKKLTSTVDSQFKTLLEGAQTLRLAKYSRGWNVSKRSRIMENNLFQVQHSRFLNSSISEECQSIDNLETDSIIAKENQTHATQTARYNDQYTTLQGKTNEEFRVYVTSTYEQCKTDIADLQRSYTKDKQSTAYPSKLKSEKQEIFAALASASNERYNKHQQDGQTIADAKKAAILPLTRNTLETLRLQASSTRSKFVDLFSFLHKERQSHSWRSWLTPLGIGWTTFTPVSVSSAKMEANYKKLTQPQNNDGPGGLDSDFLLADLVVDGGGCLFGCLIEALLA